VIRMPTESVGRFMLLHAVAPTAVSAQFLDDLQTLDRLSERADLSPASRAYAQVRVFTLRFDLSWFVVGNPV
jgi:hypothetical protein